MLKQAATSILLCMVLFLTMVFHTQIRAQTAPLMISQEKVVYNLPYPGILPDHPLYFIKVIRDRLLEIGTREPMKKAELYFLLSDKRVAMATELSKKGKDNLAMSTFSKGEKYFLKVPPLVKISEKQGVGPPSGFIDKLKQSNRKHREIAEDMLKVLPQGQTTGLNEILLLNSQVKKDLEKL